MATVAELNPVSVWKNFAAISAIPRGSRNEDRIKSFILGHAKKCGCATRQDSYGNIVAYVPANGRTGIPVVLQSHFDMVCEKNMDVTHDFAVDPLVLRVVGSTVKATGTTLGADNGMGVAIMLALMEEATAFIHPALELLFTSNEEIGLLGAAALDPSLISGARLINLDTEDFGEIYIGCAGGVDSGIMMPIERAHREDLVALSVVVRGLKGGHSGCDINTGRRNAIKLCSALLGRIADVCPLLLGDIKGGNQRNAIPREAMATIGVAKAAQPRVFEVVETALQQWRDEFGLAEPNLTLSVEITAKHDGYFLSQASSSAVLTLIAALPQGVLSYNQELKDLVETSTNVGVISTLADAVKIGMLNRSAVKSAITDTARIVRTVATGLGANVEETGLYPGWKPRASSPFLGLAKSVFAEIFSFEPTVKIVHAGLECGVLSEKFPNMDIISLGPTIRFPHSPDEEVEIATVGETYNYVKRLLAAC